MVRSSAARYRLFETTGADSSSGHPHLCPILLLLFNPYKILALMKIIQQMDDPFDFVFMLILLHLVRPLFLLSFKTVDGLDS